MENDLIFYHGGVKPDFNIEDIDIFRLSIKQQKNNKYAGFYMYEKKDINGAFKYAIDEKNRTNSDVGVIKIKISPDVKIYDYNKYNSDLFGITRIMVDKLIELKHEGYDLIKGNIMNKTEYILLNKDKIKSINYIPIYMYEEEINESKIEEENSLSKKV